MFWGLILQCSGSLLALTSGKTPESSLETIWDVGDRTWIPTVLSLTSPGTYNLYSQAEASREIEDISGEQWTWVKEVVLQHCIYEAQT